MMEKSRRRRIYLWLGYWAFLFLLTHIPVSGLGAPRIPFVDKAVHAALYFFLTLLGGRAVLSHRASSIHVIVWAIVYAAFAAADEWSQRFVGRVPDVGDWFADLVGIAVASFWIWSRQRRRAGPGSMAEVGTERRL
jgi:VanZ family protein